MKITVALLMPGFGFVVPNSLDARSDWDLRWVDRPQLTYDVAASATVGSVLSTALADWSIDLPEFEMGDASAPVERLGGVGFFHDDDYEGKGKGRRFYPHLDEDGGADWSTDILDLTFADLEQSRDAGLFEGDPQRIYLVPQVPAGGDFFSVEQTLLNWETFLHTLVFVEHWLQRIGEDAAGVAVVYTVVKKAHSTLQRLIPGWSRRNAESADVLRLLRGHRRDEDLAPLLKCTVDEVKTLRAALATADRQSSDMRPDDNSALVLEMTLLFIDVTQWSDLDEEYADPDAYRSAEALLEDILRRARNGEATTRESMEAALRPAFDLDDFDDT